MTKPSLWIFYKAAMREIWDILKDRESWAEQVRSDIAVAKTAALATAECAKALAGYICIAAATIAAPIWGLVKAIRTRHHANPKGHAHEDRTL